MPYKRSQMTKVMEVPFSGWFIRLCLLLLAASTLCRADANSTTQSHPAQDLYQQLSNVGLDPARVYHIRSATLDRASLHFTLEDGTIAFTQDVAGHVTGAFFEGDGEVLLIPPGQTERSSMILFTGGTILEEQFETAYFRFNDDTFRELGPFLGPADNGADFTTRWNESAKALAQADALRLLVTFSQMLPDAQHPTANPPSVAKNDRLLHAHLQGRKLGGFDVYYNSLAPEQIWAGQLRTVKEKNFYDVWTSFSINKQSQSSAAVNSPSGEDAAANAIRISNYRIQAQVKPPTELRAEAYLNLQVAQGGTRTILFELSRFLQVQQVLANGRPVEFIHNQSLDGTQLARKGNDVVAIVFPSPLEAGQQMELHFSYGGEVISQAGPGLLYVGERGNWYPNLGMVMSNFDLEFHYPAGWTLLATGKQAPPAATNTSGDSEQVSRWVSDSPIPFAGFNLGKYAHAAVTAQAIPVDVYATNSVEKTFPKGKPVAPFTPDSGLPKRQLLLETPALVPSPARSVHAVAENAGHAVDFFTKLFGPYPFSGLKITQIPGHVSQGWPGMIFLSTYVFLTDEEKAQIHYSPVEQTMLNLIVAHETAHQWWGDLVSWSGYRDQWLIEALANYSAMLQLRNQDPVQFRAVLDRYRDDLMVKQESGDLLMDAGPVSLGLRLSCSKFPAGYEAISYGRGTWLLFMLDSMMQDGEHLSGSHRGADTTVEDPFVKTLHQIRNEYAGKTITTQQFVSAFEANLPLSLHYEGHKSLDWFYESWINGKSIPRFALSKVKFIEIRGKTYVTGTIEEKDAVDDLVTPVPVYALLPRKQIVGQVFVDEQEVQFRLPVPAGAKKIALDPEHVLLTRP